MVNLRYHIVSITAVFLALGIGLTLGSTFLDRVTVDTLKNQLDTLEQEVGETSATNDDLTSRLGSLEERDDALADMLPERMLNGRLDEVPVLVLATEGTDDALVDRTIDALSASGATVAGTWWLTDRWLLDDAGEVTELADVLELRTDDVDRLRRNTAIRVAAALQDASEPAPAPAPPALPADPAVPVDPAVPTTTAPEPVEEPPAPPTEPQLIGALEDAGFLAYQALAGSGDERVLLPSAGVRYLVISEALPETGPALFATALLDEMTAEAVAPVVAAQGAADLRGADGQPATEGARRTSFVGPLRSGELTRDRISTVDDLDTAAGLMAVALAIEDLAVPRTGHYGVAPGATRLLPGPNPDT